MKQLNIHREDGNSKVAILKHKSEGTYSFVNLTKGHICTCKFITERDAIDDLQSQIGLEGTSHKILSVTEIHEVFNTEV